MTQRWKQSPPGSHWGEFGPDDRLGRMNLVNADKVREGIQEVREGKTFCLSLPLDVPGGRTLNARRLPPRLYGTLREGCERRRARFLLVLRHRRCRSDRCCLR